MKDIWTYIPAFRRVGCSLLTMSFMLTLCWIGTAAAGDSIVVIVNVENPVKSLTLEEVQKYYENDRLQWPDGKKVRLYDLKVKDEQRRKFSNAVLGQAPETVAMEWANKKITNTAKNPPRTVRSSTLMQARVGKDTGAIGYLLKRDITSDKVKIVVTIE